MFTSRTHQQHPCHSVPCHSSALGSGVTHCCPELSQLLRESVLESRKVAGVTSAGQDPQRVLWEELGEAEHRKGSAGCRSCSSSALSSHIPLVSSGSSHKCQLNTNHHKLCTEQVTECTSAPKSKSLSAFIWSRTDHGQGAAACCHLAQDKW